MGWSAIISDKWKLKFVPSRTSAIDFAHYQSYQSPKLLGSSPPITQVSIFGGLFHFWLNSSGESRDRIMAIIRYIWDGRQKVESPIVWDFPDIIYDLKTRLISFKMSWQIEFVLIYVQARGGRGSHHRMYFFQVRLGVGVRGYKWQFTVYHHHPVETVWMAKNVCCSRGGVLVGKFREHP